MRSYSGVMGALGWFKMNNPLYKDVIINGVTEDMFDDEDNSNGGGEDEDAHAHNDELQESGVVRLDVLHPNIPAVELLQEENAVHRQVHQLQRVTATPLSIFQDRHNLQVQAFPTLYPDGMNGFGTLRAVKILALEYFQVRMLSADARWACHSARAPTVYTHSMPEKKSIVDISVSRRIAGQALLKLNTSVAMIFLSLNIAIQEN